MLGKKKQLSNSEIVATKWAKWSAGIGAVIGLSAGVKASSTVTGKIMLGGVSAIFVSLLFGGAAYLFVYLYTKIFRKH